MDNAAFTETRNDIYLLVWLAYYNRFFKNLYVIHTQPGDPAPILEEARKRFTFTLVNDYPNPEYSYEVELNQMKDFQRKLLKSYQWVLFSHVDEIVVPDPDIYKDLNDYIKKCKKDYVFCTGMNLLHMWDEKGEPNESALDISKPILKQRKYWWYEFGYNKPLLSRVPLRWIAGMHRIEEVNDSELHTLHDKDLYLIHLKQADHKIFGERIVHEKGYNWFYKEHDKRELIPKRFKKVF